MESILTFTIDFVVIEKYLDEFYTPNMVPAEAGIS